MMVTEGSNYRNAVRGLGIAWCACVLVPSLAAGAVSHSAATVSDAVTSSAALQRLVDGNQRFVAGKPLRGDQTADHRHGLMASQHPFATILGCSDSRVPVELLFDQGFGDLFVIRVAGNVSGTDELGSIEYAVHHLHTPLIVVLGHESCGAVTSALLSAEAKSHEAAAIQDLLKQIQPALQGLDPSLSEAERVHQGVEANVRQSVRAAPGERRPHEAP
jgi:carbonic anhydrase